MYLLKYVPYIQTDTDSEKIIVYRGFTTHHISHANPSIGYVVIKKPHFFQEYKLYMHCVTLVRPTSPAEILSPCFENRTVLFLLLFHRNQKNLKWEKQMANNCCRFFKCIWMGFCICMWLCYFYKWLFWYVYFGLRKIKLSFHLFESLSLF